MRTKAKKDEALELSAAKAAYRSAEEVGNRKEEARWANVIGHMYKEKGEYVKALEWVRIDYDISSKYLHEKDLLPTCQSMGELLYRIADYQNALVYQKEHLRLAKEGDDLIEQQRASTQLGRTYYDLSVTTETNHSALHNAKKYFKLSMELAKTLYESSPSSKSSSFLKEYIDAYNNVGMLEMDLDKLEEAEEILKRGLEICDEEEVAEYDDSRSRLHNNLGTVYTKLRKWEEALEHIKKDIAICRYIGHRQGEAKGYINLGELCVKIQKFEDALSWYKRANELAKSMKDERGLVDQIEGNMQVVQELKKVVEKMTEEEQELKMLRRKMKATKGTPEERKWLKKQLQCLEGLIDKAIELGAWPKHLDFAKKKKTVARELCDKEKLGDAFSTVGESYQHIREFEKAQKWYGKSLETYKLIGNLEGQAMVNINMGNVLDSQGDCKGALKAFEEGHKFAVQANKTSVQIMALENMHYMYMMRFDNSEEARKLQLQIDNLKILLNSEHGAMEDSCSETDTEGNDSTSKHRFTPAGSSQSTECPVMHKPISSIEEVDDDDAVHSIPILRKKSHTSETGCDTRAKTNSWTASASPKGTTKSRGSPIAAVGRKRPRIVLSDDDDDNFSENRFSIDPAENAAKSHELKGVSNHSGEGYILQDVVPKGRVYETSSCNPINQENSSSSHKSGTPYRAVLRHHLKPCGYDERCIRVNVEDVLVCITAGECMYSDGLDMETLKIQVACSYYLQLSPQKRANGLLPIIVGFNLGDDVLLSRDRVESIISDVEARGWIDASISGWVQKRLIKVYIDSCQNLAETPNLKLLMKLYNLEVTEDEVIVSDCELQDMSVVPLLEALHAQKTIASLDLSHNMLGNATMERLLQVFTLSGQKHGGLTLDLHCNMFGPSTFAKICDCPVVLGRLEVLNISGNRLTDSCATSLSTVLRNCKALYNLNIERCSITSLTIQRVADALDRTSVLSHLSAGYNNFSGNSLANLLRKLATIERFSELSLNGTKLNKIALDSVCQFAKSSCLSGLMLGATSIGCDGALQLTDSLFHETQELAKFDISYCGLNVKFLEKFNAYPAICNIVQFNLSGNPIAEEGAPTLASLLTNLQGSLKFLHLNKCYLGLSGVIQIIKSLSDNESLEELHLAENVQQEQCEPPDTNFTGRKKPETPNGSNKDQIPAHGCQIERAKTDQHQQEGEVALDHLVVADSYDNELNAEQEESALEDSGSSQGQKNVIRRKNQLLNELPNAITNLKHLQLLDLSDNGFSNEIADTLFIAWSSATRSGEPRRHIKNQILHLSIKGKVCCGVKPCCRKD